MRKTQRTAHSWYQMCLDSWSLRPRLLFRVSHSVGSGLTSTFISPLVQAPLHLRVSGLERIAQTARMTSLTYFKAFFFFFYKLWSISPQDDYQGETHFFFPGEIHGVAWPCVPENISCVWLFAAPWAAARQASLSFTISRSLLKLMSIKSVMPSNCLIFCHPLLLLPSIFPSIRVFSSESDLCIRWPKYWSFSFSISPSNEYSGLISFRIDWFDLLAIQGTYKSVLQHHSSKASVL